MDKLTTYNFVIGKGLVTRLPVRLFLPVSTLLRPSSQAQCPLIRRARHSLRFSGRALQPIFRVTNQFFRSFVSNLIKMWNLLADAIVSLIDIEKLKAGVNIHLLTR